MAGHADARTPQDVAVAASGVALFVGGAVLARHPEVGALERRWFGWINRLPARWYRPVWVVMQLGSLGGVVAVAATAGAAGRTDVSRRAGAAGALAWVAAKLVKRFVGRGRPSAVVDTARVLGREQSGLGYPSGHAAVTAAMAAAAAPLVGRVAWLVPVAVGTSRVYVGAHLPLDVGGGFALGVACGTAGRRLAGLTARG